MFFEIINFYKKCSKLEKIEDQETLGSYLKKKQSFKIFY